MMHNGGVSSRCKREERNKKENKKGMRELDMKR
jgi:hypothetical protein